LGSLVEEVGFVKKRYVEVDSTVLLTPSFPTANDFSSLVEDFLIQLPQFAPTHWGLIEPINLKLTMEDLRDLLQESNSSDISWKRRKIPKGWGVFKRRTRPMQGPQFARHRLEFSVSDDRQVSDLLGYLHHLVEDFGVEYAFFDSMTAEYRPVGFANGIAPTAGNMMIFTHNLVRALPDILWSQIFGPAYVKLFGLKRLLSAPAYKVEQVGPETVYLQLSESLFDMYDCYEKVDAVRQRVKQHLDDNIIFDARNTKDHLYRVPQFKFPD
jgi:hypothetical protein